jgi:hypothetical protein
MFEKLNIVPRVAQDPHDCFFAPFLCFHVSPLGESPTASSSAKFIFAANFVTKFLNTSIDDDESLFSISSGKLRVIHEVRHVAYASDGIGYDLATSSDNEVFFHRDKQ